MATSDPQLWDISGGHEDISDVCKPCSEENIIQADRFCVDCQEYLCISCSQYHKKLTATKHHDLVNIDGARNAKPAQTMCPLHTGEQIKFICLSHSYLGCSACITINHKQCKSIDYIPKVAEDIRNLDGFKKFDEKLKALQTSCKSSLDDVEYHVELVREDASELKYAFNTFRIEMNTTFDKFENQLTAQAEQIKLEELQKLNALSTKLATYQAEVDTLIQQVETLLDSGKNCDTYVLMTKETSHLIALNDEIVNTTKRQKYKRYTLQPMKDTFKVEALGKLRTENVSLGSEKPMSRPLTDVESKPIKPGVRVCPIFQWSSRSGTAESYDSVRDRWKVKWDDGETSDHPANILRTLTTS